MKQKDIALIVVIVIVAAIASYFISKLLFTSPKNRQATVEVVQAMTDNFPEPDDKIFNAKAVDPTKLITIGDSSNPAPFKPQE